MTDPPQYTAPTPAIQPALDRAVDAYIASRREKIPGFVETHFSVTGAARLNRKAWGMDLVKAPVNLAWTLPYTAFRAAGLLGEKTGLKWLQRLSKQLPSGFTTAVQKEINRLIFTELLELPMAAENDEEYPEAVPDALLAEILNQPEIRDIFQQHLAMIHHNAQQEGFRQALEQQLKEYAVDRTAVSEMAGNLISLSAGAGALGTMTPGGFSFGAGLAAAIAQQSAISNFILGPTLGSLYYTVFPATASAGLLVASTTSVLTVLAVLTAFSGVVTDPLQAKLGIHKKRLNRLVDGLAATLKDRDDSDMGLRAQYVARIFDLMDLLKTAAYAVR
ncbi:MAG: hypothetical protein MI802_13275 [Desulfobacterales bacterium]|nr:hypothetical protein [Desulfobacterales bacterium]